MLRRLVNNGEQVTVPGPRIVVPPATRRSRIVLTNCLPDEPTSIVIPGQPFAAAPVRNADGRVRSMTPETASRTAREPYTFTGLKPGTFLYQSGSHQAVQVQMGLYGAMTKDESGRERLRGRRLRARGRARSTARSTRRCTRRWQNGTYGTAGRSHEHASTTGRRSS